MMYNTLCYFLQQGICGIWTPICTLERSEAELRMSWIEPLVGSIVGSGRVTVFTKVGGSDRFQF